MHSTPEHIFIIDMILPPQVSALRLSQSIRPSLIHRNRLFKSSTSCFRSSSTTTAPSTKAPRKKPVLPERLIVYHAGTGRTVFLGCLKVTTIFIFSFFCLVVAPTHFYAEDQSKWVAAGVMLSGIIPMVTVAYITSPFVNYIHLRLPSFARHSREMLLRYSKSLPKDAELDITTMNFIGKPRVTRVKVADLYPVNRRFGLANYARDTGEINKKRAWWMGKAVSLFGVHGGRTRIMGGEVWDNIERSVKKQ